MRRPTPAENEIPVEREEADTDTLMAPGLDPALKVFTVGQRDIGAKMNDSFLETRHDHAGVERLHDQFLRIDAVALISSGGPHRRSPMGCSVSVPLASRSSRTFGRLR